MPFKLSTSITSLLLSLLSCIVVIVNVGVEEVEDKGQHRQVLEVRRCAAQRAKRTESRRLPDPCAADGRRAGGGEGTSTNDLMLCAMQYWGDQN